MQLTRERQAQPNVVASATPNTSVFPEQRRGDESFEEWLSASVQAGQFRTVDFLQYIGQSDDDDEVGGSVVLERRIVD